MPNVNAVGETCENCGRSIGRLEAAHIYDDHIVCSDCQARLSPQLSPAPPPIPAFAQPIPVQSGFGPGAQTDRTKWLWIGGVLIIMVGLGSFRGFPNLLAAPFLIIAGALLLPPVWAQVAMKWPKVNTHSTLLRTATCVLAFAVVGLVMPKTRDQSSSPSAGANSGSNSPAPAARPELVQAPSTVGRGEVTITRSEYGDAWPFTVDSGVLKGKSSGRKLSDGTELSEITFASGGKTYYVNGTAKGTHRYAELDEIWAADSGVAKELALKKNMGPIIDRGLKLARGVNEPFVAPKLVEPPVAVALAPVKCDQFDILAAFEAGESGSSRRVRISIKTDLPDSTNLMVSIDRSFLNSADNEEYSIAYVEEKSTVEDWRAGKVIELNQAKWQAKLEEKRATFRKIGEKLIVTRLDNAVAVSFVVPVNQSDKRFGLRNVNLTGTAVQDSDGLRVVRRKSKLAWTVDSK